MVDVRLVVVWVDVVVGVGLKIEDGVGWWYEFECYV